MAVVLPPGVKVEIALPPHSILPTASNRDAATLIVAATCTPHFPQAKEALLHLVNRGVAAYKYVRPPQQLNREQRRRIKKGR